MKKFDIAILGAGASGIMCAININSNKNVLLLDKASSPAKKLMATGNGRCNLTNLNLFPSLNFYNQNLDKYFQKFNQNDTLKFLEKNGLVYYSDDEGRVYPISNYAKSVIDVFVNALQQKKKISLAMSEEILSVKKEKDLFEIKTDKASYFANKVVVALGGKASKTIIESFNIDCKHFTPSLCALKSKEDTRILSGIRLSPVKITATTQEGHITQTYTGEVLFKENGLSGIVVFNLSSIFSRTGKFEGKILIDIMPQFEKSQLINFLTERTKILNLPISKFFEGFLANQVAYYILNKCKFDETKHCSTLSKAQIELLASHIKKLEFTIKGFYDNNQIYSGGAKLTSLDESLQSTQVKNMYFCGESCDVDGICGGYNLQWAWTSGKIVADELNK